MGLCGSKAIKEPKVEPVKEVKKEKRDAKVALKEQDTTSKLLAFLKTTDHKVFESHISEYFLFIVQTEKRTQIYRSGQKCGDDKEQGQEILSKWSGDIITQFGNLEFELEKRVKLRDCVAEDSSQTDVFQPFADQALKFVQDYLDSSV
jgi:nitrate reductase assembly molybdenum cofactor insertion protein NarJ